MDAHGIERSEVVSASRKLGRAEAIELAKQVAKLIVVKGKSVQVFSGGKVGPEIVDAMLGPTGNLRAPALRSGKTLVIGFHEDVYRENVL